MSGIEQPSVSLAVQIAAFQEEMASKAAPELVAAFAEHAASLGALPLERVPAVGEPARPFTLPDGEGAELALGELLARGPVVVVFFRGGWCPYCNLELRAYQAALPEIEAAGASLVAISPQSAARSAETVEKASLGFPVLTDARNEVARVYGLTFTVPEGVRGLYRQVGNDLADWNGDESWELPIPGTFVIAPDGTIALAFAAGDYRRRLEPGDVLDALHGLRVGA